MNKKTSQKSSATVGVDIIVPVYNAAADVAQCVASVLEKTSGDYRLILIDDASPSPDIGRLFERWEKEDVPQRILLRNEVNLGFTGTANRGMRLSHHAHPRRDVVLLNSDTIVTTGWLEALQRCVYSEDRIGTATPFSNNAEICSYPRFCADNGWPEGKDPELVRAALRRAAVPSYPDIPTGVGFCFYIKRALLDSIGFFDEAFGAGYGEENDFCLRAKKAGFRNVLCDDAFVVHLGERSFEGRKQELGGRNMSVLLGKHPEYLEVVSRFIARDPLRSIRTVAQLEEDKANIPRNAVLHIVHTHGGGTELHARKLIRNSPPGWRHYLAIVDSTQWRIALAPKDGSESPILCVARRDDETWESFVEQLCGSLGVGLVHVHNVSGCRDGILSAFPKLSIPYGYTTHDLSIACPTITFLNPDERYCGGQTETTVCQNCLRQQEDFSHIDIAAWRQAHDAFVQKARFIIAPSHWAREMFARYFPGVAVKRIEHAIPSNPIPSRNLSALVFADSPWPTVAVLGAVGPDKGARRLERLVALAAEQNAAVRFVLIGYLDRQHGPWQSDDGRLLVHGRYTPDDFPALMDYYKVKLVLYPSAGPETFCYTLSETWQAGRPALVPPFGALAERMQEHGAGWIMSDEEWRDEAHMLQRLLTLLDPAHHEAFQEKVACARQVSLPTMENMVAATLTCYEQTLSIMPPVSERPSFPPIRLRDGLGYTGGLSINNAGAKDARNESARNANALGWAIRFRQTPVGRALRAMLPQSVVNRLKNFIKRM
ncbi:MAG: glycosyltransferase [Proteobacteria bacterium]|nr:glycosyltransferase [Pseudomonadota bacterium]MCL2308157.1 glycosyltransferase [Pseudomonadota bacterium]